MLIETAGEVLALMCERYSGTARTGGTEARYSQVLHVSIKRSKTRAYSALRGAARMERANLPESGPYKHPSVSIPSHTVGVVH